MLFLVGLGLGSEKDITVEGLEVVKRAQRVYLEAYTSVLIGAQDGGGLAGMELQKGKEKLERFYGREIILADRDLVEGSSDEILAEADEIDVAFLVVGDPFGATTHTDLALRASDLKIEVRTFHNASILNAVGAAGLSLYNYGQTISIPLWTERWRPTSFLSRIEGNRRVGAHTLALLDIKVKEQSEENMARGRKIYEPPRYMDVPTACQQLLDSLVGAQTTGLPCTENTLILSCSRLGTDSQTIILAPLCTLARIPPSRFGGPLHSLVILGGLVHPIEREVLSKWMVDDNGDALTESLIAGLWKTHDQEWVIVQGLEAPTAVDPTKTSNPMGNANHERTESAGSLTAIPKGRRISPASNAVSISPTSSRSPLAVQQLGSSVRSNGGYSLSSSNKLPAFYRGSPSGRTGFVSSSPGTRTVIETMSSGPEMKPKSPKREIGFATDLAPIQDVNESKGLGKREKNKGENFKGSKAPFADNAAPVDGKSKAELKAERRAKQEAQRAAKASTQENSAKPGDKRVEAQPPVEPRARRISVSAAVANASTNKNAGSGAANTARKGALSSGTDPKSKLETAVLREPKTVSLFGHLEHGPSRKTMSERLHIHPSIRSLGVQMSEFKIIGANARAIALLLAFKKIIRDYSTPSGTSLSRHLMNHLNPQISHLVAARPLGVSMGNAIRYIKYEISVINIDLPEEDAKTLLCEKIDHFIRDRIMMADRLIVEHAVEKIITDDVILIYGRSSVVEATLLEAKARKTDFSVIVVDSAPLHEGRECLVKLVKADIPTTFISISALGSVVQRVTKLFLGAAALFSNGACYARAGTASVALAVKEKGAPVLVLCESYKFSDRVQLDSIVSNELGSPDNLLQRNEEGQCDDVLQDWRSTPSIALLNLLYDVTLPEYITTLVTEIGLVPVTSVPIVLREYRPIMAS